MSAGKGARRGCFPDNRFLFTCEKVGRGICSPCRPLLASWSAALQHSWHIQSHNESPRCWVIGDNSPLYYSEQGGGLCSVICAPFCPVILRTRLRHHGATSIIRFAAKKHLNPPTGCGWSDNSSFVKHSTNTWAIGVCMANCIIAFIPAFKATTICVSECWWERVECRLLLRSFQLSANKPVETPWRTPESLHLQLGRSAIGRKFRMFPKIFPLQTTLTFVRVA